MKGWIYKCSKCFTRHFKDFETHFSSVCLSNQQPKPYSPLTYYFSTTSFWIFFLPFSPFLFLFLTTISHFVFSFLWNFLFELYFCTPFFFLIFSFFFSFFFQLFLTNYPHTCLFVQSRRLPKHIRNKKS